MKDPNDKSTPELVDVASGRPALPLAELIEAAEAAPVLDAVEDDQDGPMDDAARQRKARAKRKALGKKAVYLNDLERETIRCALEMLHDIQAPGLASTLDATLTAVMPGATWPARPASTTKPALNEDLRTAQQLRKELTNLESEYALCLTERAQAWDAVTILQKRLARANLPTDCRPHALEQL